MVDFRLSTCFVWLVYGAMNFVLGDDEVYQMQSFDKRSDFGGNYYLFIVRL